MMQTLSSYVAPISMYIEMIRRYDMVKDMAGSPFTNMDQL